MKILWYFTCGGPNFTTMPATFEGIQPVLLHGLLGLMPSNGEYGGAWQPGTAQQQQHYLT